MFYSTAADSLQLLMEVAPSSDMDFILTCFKHIQFGTDLARPVPEVDPIEDLKPLEVAGAAVFENLVLSGEISVQSKPKSHSCLVSLAKAQFL